MLTFDSFTFYEVTFLFFVILGLGAALLSDDEEPEEGDPVTPFPARHSRRGLAPAPAAGGIAAD